MRGCRADQEPQGAKVWNTEPAQYNRLPSESPVSSRWCRYDRRDRFSHPFARRLPFAPPKESWFAIPRQVHRDRRWGVRKMRESLSIIRVTHGRSDSFPWLVVLLVVAVPIVAWGRKASDPQTPTLPESGLSSPVAPRVASGDSVVLWRAKTSPRVPEMRPAAVSEPLPMPHKPAPLPPLPRPYPYGWFGAEPRTQGEWRPDVYDRYHRQLWK